ncbi:heparinase II/III family protein [Pelagibacterium xiamenense]|uniref:heparinase II/III family protein n=1 Tax=Pelagibacterium xiamenense TaxID=2901140 RepID=UPI001E599C8E|nr:heparinase II/III family protein [Pelagibacterium xiamenense]MCD7059881.1 heparinase II/III family protein [Pelagibacterium xiamenense]
MTDLRQYSVRRVAEALEGQGAFAPYPPGSERAAWAGIAGVAGREAVDRMAMLAAQDRDTPLEALPASLYFDFKRTGRREGYEDALRARRNRLYRMTIDECIRWQGDNLDPLSDIIWARLEETNWAWPAHAGDMDPPDSPRIDLAAAMTALDLAEIDYLLGDKLDPMLRRHIRAEIDRRCFTPFLARHDHWWLSSRNDRPLNNWTAVCVAGVVGAACFLEADSHRLAEIIARGMPGLAEYLETFDNQGGSTEGPDYWSYGFGNYVVLAQLLEARTGGKIDLYAPAIVREAAQFPLRTMVGPGLWISFSDSDERPSFLPALLRMLSQRLDLPGLEGMGVTNDYHIDHVNQFVWLLRQYLWPLREDVPAHTPSGHDWFEEMQVMIARRDPRDPDALQFAAKGGHNAEMHNQNDVGSFVVAHNGEVVLTDLGRGRYSKAYFGPQRYEFLTNSSLGHSVPAIDGKAQLPGIEHAARVLEHAAGTDVDRLVLDLSGAYGPDAGLERLEREFVFARDGKGSLTLTDRYGYRNGVGGFESVLITTGDAALEEGCVKVWRNGAELRVSFDSEALNVAFDRHSGIEKQSKPPVDVTRIVFSPREHRQAGAVTLVIRPA